MAPSRERTKNTMAQGLSSRQPPTSGNLWIAVRSRREVLAPVRPAEAPVGQRKNCSVRDGPRERQKHPGPRQIVKVWIIKPGKGNPAMTRWRGFLIAHLYSSLGALKACVFDQCPRWPGVSGFKREPRQPAGRRKCDRRTAGNVAKLLSRRIA